MAKFSPGDVVWCKVNEGRGSSIVSLVEHLDDGRWVVDQRAGTGLGQALATVPESDLQR